MDDLIPNYIVEAAIKVANRGDCVKSKRGVIIWNKKNFIDANNSPPFPFMCDKRCKNGCSKIAVHAEQRAIIAALEFGCNLEEYDMMHVKTVDGELVPSGPPSCLECSKLIVEAGLQNMWLYHHNGWKKYHVLEFHERTMQHNGIFV